MLGALEVQRGAGHPVVERPGRDAEPVQEVGEVGVEPTVGEERSRVLVTKDGHEARLDDVGDRPFGAQPAKGAERVGDQLVHLDACTGHWGCIQANARSAAGASEVGCSGQAPGKR